MYCTMTQHLLHTLKMLSHRHHHCRVEIKIAIVAKAKVKASLEATVVILQIKAAAVQRQTPAQAAVTIARLHPYHPLPPTLFQNNN